MRAVQRCALAVGGQQQYGQVLGQARARLRLRSQRAPQVGVAVHADAAGFLLPAVHAAHGAARGSRHAFAGGPQPPAHALFGGMVEFVEIERPAGDQADAAQLGEYGLVRGVRRIPAQQLGRVGEEGVRRHGFHLLSHRSGKVQGRIGAQPLCLRREVPLRKRR
ncbi:hypothetical protein D9M68_610150 [compost metagenome]